VEMRTPSIVMQAVERLAARDATLFSDPAVAAERMGWIGLPAHAAAEAPRLAEVAADFVAQGITDVVLLGMGGSSLAPLVLSRAIGSAPGHPALHVLDTTSPSQVSCVLSRLKPASTLVLVSSKSGTTIEPLSLMAIFHEWMERELGENAYAHFVAITDIGSPLEALAEERGFAHVLHAPGDVGGRYAALTPFATMPAALIGVDVPELAAFAEAAETACLALGPDNPGAALAAWMSDAYRDGRDKLTLVCSPGLESFGLWVEQLVAESTGKRGGGLLPVLEPCPGLPSAHAADRLTFVLRTSDDTELAALAGLLPDGEPVFETVLDDPYALGAEFVIWEWAVALFSALAGIEPFDQPDVEEAKAATREILDGRSAALLPVFVEDGSSVTLAGVGEPTDLRGALHALLAGGHPGSYLCVLAYVPEDESVLGPLRAACAEVSDELRIAVTLELGPRYLHSTGQYHKGGPAHGLFLVVTAKDETDLPVPGAAFTLAALHAAQPAADVATLCAQGRAVVAVQLAAEDPARLAGLAQALVSAVR
jgi:transaldolase/glucose-6-phosphate isomerase